MFNNNKCPAEPETANKDNTALDKGVLHAGDELLEGDEGGKMQGNDLPRPTNGVAPGTANMEFFIPQTVQEMMLCNMQAGDEVLEGEVGEARCKGVPPGGFDLSSNGKPGRRC